MNSVVRKFSPSLGLWADTLLVESILVLGKLAKERWPHLKVRSSGVQELQSLEKTPSITPHHECSDHKAGSILGFAGLNQH